MRATDSGDLMVQWSSSSNIEREREKAIETYQNMETMAQRSCENYKVGEEGSKKGNVLMKCFY